MFPVLSTLFKNFFQKNFKAVFHGFPVPVDCGKNGLNTPFPAVFSFAGMPQESKLFFSWSYGMTKFFTRFPADN